VYAHRSGPALKAQKITHVRKAIGSL
jgi:hypothetical protein